MPVTFRDLIAENKRKSFWLVVLFALFTVVVVSVLGLAIILYVDPELVNQISWGLGIFIGLCATAVSCFIIYLAYMSGDQFILGISGARPLEKADDPQLFDVVEEIAIAAGIPMPKVYLIPDSAPTPSPRAAIRSTPRWRSRSGLHSKLNREELQGVIAHEISHIRNFDIRLMMLLAVLIGTIVMLADFYWQILWYSGGGHLRGDRGENKGNGLVMLIIFVIAVVLAMIAPLLAQIIQLAVSRQREYLADASGVELTRNPLGLASALRKIDDDPDVLKTANRGTAHLYIANPIKKFEGLSETVFASHPPIKDRIRRLESLVHQ